MIFEVHCAFPYELPTGRRSLVRPRSPQNRKRAFRPKLSDSEHENQCSYQSYRLGKFRALLFSCFWVSYNSFSVSSILSLTTSFHCFLTEFLTTLLQFQALFLERSSSIASSQTSSFSVHRQMQVQRSLCRHYGRNLPRIFKSSF